MSKVVGRRAWDAVPGANFTIKCTDGDIKVHQLVVWCACDAVKSFVHCCENSNEMPIRFEMYEIETALCYIYGQFAEQMDIPVRRADVASVPWKLHTVFVELGCDFANNYTMFDVRDLLPWKFTLASVMKMNASEIKKNGIATDSDDFTATMNLYMGIDYELNKSLIPKMIEMIETVRQNCSSPLICDYIADDCRSSLQMHVLSKRAHGMHDELKKFFNSSRTIYASLDSLIKIRGCGLRPAIAYFIRLLLKDTETADEMKVNVFSKLSAYFIFETAQTHGTLPEYEKIYGESTSLDAAIEDFKSKKFHIFGANVLAECRQLPDKITCKLGGHWGKWVDIPITDDIKEAVMSDIPYYQRLIENFDIYCYE